jgi:hypothetical protein
MDAGTRRGKQSLMHVFPIFGGSMYASGRVSGYRIFMRQSEHPISRRAVRQRREHLFRYHA